MYNLNMLTKEEVAYLKKIDPLRKAMVYPYDPNGKKLGEEIVTEIKDVFPNAEVKFMGSVSLEISGQKDIDIYILADPDDFGDYLPGLEKMYGKIDKQGDYVKKRFIEWKFKRSGYDIEIYLTEPPGRQIKVYEILKSNKDLLNEYEQIKLKFSGKRYKDYQRAKYEFYNKILGGDNKY